MASCLPRFLFLVREDTLSFYYSEGKLAGVIFNSSFLMLKEYEDENRVTVMGRMKNNGGN